MSNTPSRAEIESLWDCYVGEPTAKLPLTRGDKFAFACAVLAKWGTPQPAPLSDDTKRLDWMDKDTGERVLHLGACWYTRPTYGQPHRKQKNLRAAIDAALAAQGGK